MYQIVLVFLLSFFNTFELQAESAMFGLGFGYEGIYGLTQNQSKNLFARVSISKNFLTISPFKLVDLYLGLEVAARNGFYGSLVMSDEMQDDLGGPTPIVLSSPEIELLTTIKTNIGETRSHLITKFGFDFSMLKINRSDFASSNSANFLAYIGLGFELYKKNEIFILASSSIPLTQLHCGESYSIKNPYAQEMLLIGFAKAF